MNKYKWLITLSLIVLIIIIITTLIRYIKIDSHTELSIMNSKHDETQFIFDIEDRYTNLTNKMKLPNGGFGVEPFNHQFANIYSTYFITKSLLDLDYIFNTYEKNDIVYYLNSSIINVLDSNNPNIIYDLYYYIDLLDSLGVTVDNIEHFETILHTLNKLKDDNGTYFSSFQDTTEDYIDIHRIYPTYLAITILNKLGLETDSKSIYWINEMLNNITINNENIVHIITLLKTLRLADNDSYVTHVEKYKNTYAMNIENCFNSTNLFEVSDCIEIININKIEPLDNRIVDFLIKSQNKDGGWSYTLENYNDEQGIYLAIKILNFFNEDIPNKDTLINTLLNRRSYFGGFSPFYLSTISIRSTFFIYTINDILNLPINYDDVTKEFIRNRLENLDFYANQPFDKFMIFSLSHHFGLDNIHEDEIIVAIENSIIKREDVHIYHYLLMVDDINPIIKEQIKDLFNQRKDQLDFNQTLVMLNILILIGEYDPDMGLTLLKKYDSKIVENIEGNSVVLYLLSSVLKNSYHVSESKKSYHKKLVSINKQHLNNHLEKLYLSKEPLILEELYYTLMGVYNYK